MDPITDAELLGRFAASGDGEAFAGLLERHAPMVHGVALRCAGSVEMAEEVSQTVFALLAAKAASVPAGSIAGWLHTTAFLTARNARRKAARYRQALERLTHHTDTMHSPAISVSASWEDVRPHLDEALSRLSAKSRQSVILRYFESHSIRETASATGRTEEASRKDLNRSVLRMRHFLAGRGIIIGGPALTAILAGQNLCAPPPSAAALISASLQSIPAAGLFTKTVYFMTASQTAKTAVAGLVLAIVPTALLWRQNAALKEEVRALHSSVRAVKNPELGSPAVKLPKDFLPASAREWSGDAGALAGKDGPLTAKLEQALVVGDPFTYSLAVQLLGQMKASEVPEVFEYLRTHGEWAASGGSDGGPAVWQAFWMAWGALDPEAALRQIEAGIPVYQYSDRAEAFVFNGLVMKDPRRAAALAESRTNEVSRKWAAEATACRWADTDPAAATRWALSRLEGPCQAAALKGIPWSIVRTRNSAETLEWWRSLPDGGIKEASFKTLVEIAGNARRKATLEESAAIFEEGAKRGLRSESLEVLLAGKYAESDPLAGLKALTALPPIENREAYRPIGSLVRKWAQNDPEAAGTWLREQTANPWGEAAVRGYIAAIEKENPEAAAQWKQTLGGS